MSNSRIWTSQPQVPITGVEGFGWVPANGGPKTPLRRIGRGGQAVSPDNASPADLSVGNSTISGSQVTYVLIFAAPVASTGAVEVLRQGAGSPASSGVRCDISTSASGINAVTWALNATGALVPGCVIDNGSVFDTRPYVTLLSCSPSGTLCVTGCVGPNGNTVSISNAELTTTNIVTSFARELLIRGDNGLFLTYGAFVIPRTVGVVEARDIIRNPWRLATPLPGRSWGFSFAEAPPPTSRIQVISSGLRW